MKKVSMVKVGSINENNEGSTCAKAKVFIMDPELKKYQAEFINIQFICIDD
jgi:hypothetical protein